MDTNRSTAQDQQALTAAAHQLQRAAGSVLEHAAAADDPAALGVALARIEEALDRLSTGMLQAAHAVGGGAADESGLEPSAEALSFYLRLTAERLRDPQLACQSARYWTRRSVAAERTVRSPLPMGAGPGAPDV